MMGLYDLGDRRNVECLKNAVETYFRLQQPRGQRTVTLQLSAFGGESMTIDRRGWSYNSAFCTRPYASMTAAGIGSQAILCRMLQKAGALDADVEKKIVESINAGLAWMQDFYSVDESRQENSDGSNALGESRFYHNYYLFALEKAATMAEVKRMGIWSWYRDLCAALLCDQYPDGRFYNECEWSGPDVATAFGLLVLKNASSQIRIDLTGGQAVSGPK